MAWEMSTWTRSETDVEHTQPQFNAFGFCVECGLERMDAERWEDRERRQVISVLDRHVRCNHVLIYRTLKREWR